MVPAGLNETSYLVAVIIAQDGDTDLDSATIIPQGKFAGTGGGGGSVADTLQTAYDNSSSPEIVTDATRGAVDFRVGSGSDSDNVVTFQQNSGTINAFVEGTGNAKFETLSGDSLNILSLPTLNNSATDILVRNSSTGVVEYRPVSGITPDTNTFVTGFTYDDANTFTITRNDDISLSSTINQMSGLTINGNLVVTGTTNISGITTVDSTLQVDGNVNITSNSFFFQGTSVGGGNVSLIGVDSSDVIRIGNLGFDNYIEDDTTINGVLTADTIFLATTPTLNNSGTDILVRNSSTGEVEYRPVSGITPDTNTFVTGSTVSANTLTLTRNDLQDVLLLSGGTNAQFIDNGNNSITLNVTSGGGGGASVSFPWKFKEPTTSGDPGSGQFRLNDTVPSGITEIYVNDETNNSIDASNLLNILDVGDVIYIQQNDDATRALLFTVSASTVDNTGWFTIPVQYQQGSTIPKKDKVCGWIFASTGAEDNTVSNVGVGQGVFKQRNVNDFEFYSLSGGNNTTLTLNNDTIVIDVTIPPDTDTFVSGGTYNDTTNNINFSGNSAETTFDVDLTSLVSSVSANTFVISGTYVDSTDTLALLRNDGNFVNITGITDTFTTGATYDNGTALATFNRNDGNSYTLDLSTIDVNDTFSTGGTVTQSSSNNENNQTIQIVGNDGFTPYNITNITDTFTTGGTYNNGTALITFDKNDGTTYDVDLSTLDLNDTFVTGTTFGSNQATVTRNDGTDVLFLTGGTKISLTNPSTNQIKIDVTPTLNITTVSTTTYTATTSDEIIGVDTSSNAVTITLPDSLSSGTLRYEIKDIGFNSRSNPITIQASGSDGIRTTSLVSSFTLSADGGAVVLINTATREWWQM